MKKLNALLALIFCLLINIQLFASDVNMILDFDEIAALDWNPVGSYAWGSDQVAIVDNPGADDVNNSLKTFRWIKDGAENAWGAFAIHYTQQQFNDFERLVFYVRGTTEINTLKLKLIYHSGGADVWSHEFPQLQNLNIPADTWQRMVVIIPDGWSDQIFNRLQMEAYSGSTGQANFYFTRFALEKGEEGPYAVTGVSLNQTNLALPVGHESTLIATITPAHATNKTVTWETSDAGVASVANGVVTAEGVGTATITVRTEDGDFTATCQVVVTDPISVTGVSLSEATISLDINESKVLFSTIVPANADNKDVAWSSDDATVATVLNGIVRGIGQGVATITVTTVDGDFTATCEVTVSDQVLDHGLVVANWENIIPVEVPEANNWQYFAGGTRTIIANPVPDAENSWEQVLAYTKNAATWQLTGFYSLDGYELTSNIISLEVPIYGENLEQVFYKIETKDNANADATAGLLAGQWNTLVINIPASWNNKLISNILIFPNPNHSSAQTFYIGEVKFNEAVVVTGVTLDQTTKDLIVGQSFFLSPSIQPANADNQDVTWSSSDTNVATVNTLGQVTAVGAGTATITVTTVDGGFTATCEVTVTAPIVNVTGVTLGETQITLDIDDTHTLVATVNPGNATDKSVTWESSDINVATVANGLVTAISAGTATITVTTTDGSFTATCEVIVLHTNISELTAGKVILYPNPFHGNKLHVELGDLNGDVTVQIFSLVGQLVKETNAQIMDGKMSLTLNLTTGTYLLKIKNQGGERSQLFVVQ